MDEAKKKLRNMQKMAELLGLEVAPEEIVKAATTASANSLAIEISREAEAVLSYGIDRRKFTQKECANCGGTFAVDRANVNYCSNTCRAHSLERIGIIWDWRKNVEARWDFREPLVISPPVLERLQTHLESFPVQIEPEPLSTVVMESLPPVLVSQLNQDEVDDLLASL